MKVLSSLFILLFLIGCNNEEAELNREIKNLQQGMESEKAITRQLRNKIGKLESEKQAIQVQRDLIRLESEERNLENLKKHINTELIEDYNSAIKKHVGEIINILSLKDLETLQTDEFSILNQLIRLQDLNNILKLSMKGMKFKEVEMAYLEEVIFSDKEGDENDESDIPLFKKNIYWKLIKELIAGRQIENTKFLLSKRNSRLNEDLADEKSLIKFSNAIESLSLEFLYMIFSLYPEILQLNDVRFKKQITGNLQKGKFKEIERFYISVQKAGKIIYEFYFSHFASIGYFVESLSENIENEDERKKFIADYMLLTAKIIKLRQEI
jgi:hypothetical protein